MSERSFVHLHVHSHYSLLDGATRIGALVERAKAFDMPAVAITDHGNMFGAIEFYQAAQKVGVKPIIGCELYLAPGHRREKTPPTARDFGSSDGSADTTKDYFHLLVLAMNLEGYQNLMRLSTIGYTEGFYRKPRIDKEVLREYSAGLICTSTCLGGEIPQTLLNKDRAAAEEIAKTYLEIFGPDRFFVELQDHGIEEQKTLNPELIDMADRLGVGMIATNDVHYLEHDDHHAHDVLCCISTGKMVEDENRFKFSTDQFYFKTSEEMATLFPNHPQALDNTLRIAEMCNLELDLTRRHAPVYRVPDEVCDEQGEKLTDAAYLKDLVYQGAKERYGGISDELRERIDYELEVITSKGFASYFLIVWDCVNFARKRGIPISARGSGCSSVVSYCLYISRPDPLRYELYFERFMDPDRDEMPDIDLDICQEGRQDVIDYVRGKYGHVAQIITFGTLKAKAAIKDVSRVMGLGFEEANKLTKLVPDELKITLDAALAREPELKKAYDSDEKVKRIIDVARRLEGCARHAGVHAAGVVVADEPLVNFLPLYQPAGQDNVITQYDGPTVEKVGLLKMDFLGLRTLSILERARQLAERSSGRKINLEEVDLNDQEVYSVFARGDTRGVFQFESGGMRDVVMRMKPNRIEDLIAANALFRPGPMEYIPEYIERKHGRKWSTPHEIMTEVLEETYGIMVYQEQVSRVVNRLGGIELKAAFRLAKAISKKNTSMIEAMREPFLEGCEGNGVHRKVAEQVFEDILKFGGYAFNKAHSTGYALVAFQTAWMKRYHPVEFMAAVMTFEMSSTEKVGQYRDDCKGMGIVIEPPDINASELDFVVERRSGVDRTEGARVNGQRANGTASDDFVGEATASSQEPKASIRFGLGAIKGVGAKAVNAIVSAREDEGPFRDLFDLCRRVDLGAVNRAALEALICAGAFDRTGGMRKAFVDTLDAAISSGHGFQRDLKAGQMLMFDQSGDEGDESELDHPCLSRAEWDEAEMLAREKAVMGFYITKHPLASHERILTACATARTVDLSKHSDGTEVVLGGMVSSLRTVTTRSGRNPGKSIGIVTIEDLSGKIEAILFPEQLALYRSLLAPDAIVFLEGAVDRKREQPSLRVSRVVPREKAAEMLTASVILDIGKDAPIDELVSTLGAHRGDASVYLNVPTADGMIGQVLCSPSLKVACSSTFVDSMRELLGPDSVALLGAQRRSIPISTF